MVSTASRLPAAALKEWMADLMSPENVGKARRFIKHLGVEFGGREMSDRLMPKKDIKAECPVDISKLPFTPKYKPTVKKLLGTDYNPGQRYKHSGKR